MKTEKIVSTKVQEKDEAGNAVEPVKTALTIDWEGCSEEEIRAMAQAALIVKLQGGWRKNGIPAKVEVKASDYKVGARTPAVKLTVEEQINALTPEQRQALIDKLLAG